MDFDWIFFDCFNTLLDETGDHTGLGSARHLAVELGFFSDEAEFAKVYERVRRGVGEPGRETILADRLTYCLENSNTAGSCSVSQGVEQMLARWEQEYFGTLRPTPGVAEMLAHWHGRKKLGVISNFYATGMPAQYLQAHGLSRYFDFVIDSAAFGYRKPHRRIFEHALSLAGKTLSEATEVLFIGDRVDLDVRTPLDLGMQVVHFNREREAPEPLLGSDKYRTIAHWDEFR